MVHPLRAGFGKGWEMLQVARTLASTGVYGDPFQLLPTGPTAMLPPGYPFLMSIVLRITGDGLPFALAGNILSIGFHGLYVVLLWKLAQRWLPGRPAATATAALASLIPAVPLMPQWDTIVTAAGTLAFLLYAEKGSRAFAGAFAGVLSLFNPISLPITVLRGVWVYRLGSLPFIAVLFIAMTPWMARNYLQFGTWNMRTNFGTTVYVSNNDCALPGILETIRSGCYNKHHPNKDTAEAQLVRDMGEFAYDKKRTADTLQWIQTHPQRTAELALGRFVQYWFPTAEEQSPYAQAIWLTTLLSMGGFVAMARDRIQAWPYMAAVSLLLPLPYYFVVADIRYRVPIMWVSQLAGGYLLARIISGSRSAWSPHDVRARH
jgi:hypothetical protein